MTAEIAIANRGGVALAADSAVTVRTPDGDKIWRTANKLFHLSKVQPVGLMVFGAADLAGIPWETLVKVYRHQLAGKSFDRLCDYTDDFVAFLNSLRDFEQDIQAHALAERAKRALLEVREVVDGAVSEMFDAGPVPIKEVNDTVRRLARGLMAEIAKDECFEGFADREAEIAGHYRGEIEASVDAVFGKFDLSRATRRSLVELVALLETRVATGSHSGVVVAGFGEAELFPRVNEILVDGVVLGQPRVRRKEPAEISAQNGASIIPFAQKDEVHTFMRGISPFMFQAVNQYWERVVADLPTVLSRSTGVPDAARNKVSEAYEEAMNRLVRDFREAMLDLQEDHSIMPILRSVAVVPKDELAAMAEALVELTSFRRRVDISTSETVGGAIDVAVISKGDGFVWIKRKHYFDMALNPHWQANYLKGT